VTEYRDDPRDPARVLTPKSARRRWWRLLLPAVPDVLALLVAQGEVSVTGLDAFAAWSHGGGPQAAAAVRSAQHAAYRARRELLEALQAALSTPVDQEDLYVLSERVDRILNEARNTVREAEILGWTPSAHAARMAERLAAGTRALLAGFALCPRTPKMRGAKPTPQATPCTTSSATTAKRWQSCSR
jgi:hypothetical protein